jgi:cyclic pyranopterin monophosphate synthase
VNSTQNEASGLTHLDESGRACMVDVGDKAVTSRHAKASGRVFMAGTTLEIILGGGLKKGDALSVARLAGIMAAKKTADLVPLCHPLALSHISVEVEPNEAEGCVDITADVRCEGRTGVEMEALTAVAVAGLTLYDMVKAVDKNMVISDIQLLEKSGGRSGNWSRKRK